MNAVTKLEPQAQVPAPITPAQMLQIAVGQNADLDKLQKLMELQERWEANEARKAFVAAMSAFKADPPHIVKNKGVAYNNTRYSHATHDEVTNKIAAALSKHGLSHRWDVAQIEGRITVTCHITHNLGHGESVSMTATADTSGQKNAIQAIGSAVTYLQRYTLLAATGMSTSDMPDDDGRGAQVETITREQVATLEAMLTEIGPDARRRYLKAAKMDSLEQLPAKNYQAAYNQIDARRKEVK